MNSHPRKEGTTGTNLTACSPMNFLIAGERKEAAPAPVGEAVVLTNMAASLLPMTAPKEGHSRMAPSSSNVTTSALRMDDSHVTAMGPVRIFPNVSTLVAHTRRGPIDGTGENKYSPKRVSQVEAPPGALEKCWTW